jgi:PAS domain S-box-containing protein
VRRSLLWGNLVALIFVLLVLFLGFVISDIFRQEIPALLFLLAVMLSALIAGARSGLVATLISFLVIAYLFIPPTYSLAILLPEDYLRLALFVAQGVAISFIIQILHVARRRALNKAQIVFAQDAQLKQAHKRTTDILESITDAFFTLNDHWQFTYINKQAESLLRHRRAKLLSKNIWDTFPDMVNSEIYSLFKKAKKSRKTIHFEISYQPFKAWLNVHVYPFHEGLSVYISDETERRLAQEALLETEKKMLMLTRSPFIGIAFGEDNDKIVYANEAYLSITGQTREAIEKKTLSWQDITPRKWWAADQQAMAEAHVTGFCKPYEKEYHRPDGSRVPVLIAFITYGDNRENAVIFVMDISQRKELERQKEEFLAEVSHELKTPVTGIKAYEQILKKHFQKSRNRLAAELLDKMEGQIDKIDKFINELLDATRLESGKLELEKTEVDLDQLVADCVDNLQTTSPTHRILVRGKAGQPVIADRARAEQVLTNLLNNAIKYSPGADKVQVEVSGEEGLATVCIKDFGIGIPKKEQSKLFKRMSRVNAARHRSIAGLGLGLYIASQIIKRLDGKLWFKSQAGKGSTFCFSLPAKKP